MSVKLEGFRELDKALSELPKATGRNVLKKAAHEGAAVFQKEAEHLAPDDPVTSGRDLHSTITVENVRAKPKFSRGKFRGQAKNWWGVTISPTRYWGRFQEFGTFKMSPQPFMTPAFDGKVREVIIVIGDSLKTHIAKATARLAKKRAKGR